MTEYIEREALIERCVDIARCAQNQKATPMSWSDAYLSFADEVDDFPSADVAPVRHGKWESVKNPQWPAYSHDKCSICGWWNTKNALCYDGHKKPGHSLNYCPNCGAKMDLEGGDG